MLKYNSDNPIDKKKLEDLVKMKSFIPQAYHHFYDNLSCNNDTDAEYVDSDTDMEYFTE